MGQLFNIDDRGQVLLNSKKTYQALENEFQIQIDWGEMPRSFATYLSDGLVNINSQQFSKSLHKTRSNHLPPATQWTSITIFLRTIWTNVKEANTRRNLLQATPVSPNCTNCGSQPERTTLFLDCPLAMHIWTTIISDFNEQLLQDNPTSQTIPVNSNLIMFNYIQDWPSDDSYRDIIDIVMTIKHRIYRYKFRDNLQRIPSNREALLFAALDIEKIILIRQHTGLDYSFIEKVNNKIKDRVGL